ncbi:metal ABC transporter solute-binding protein, Zn/Mn family [Bifidobacterium aquikefiri]|uniref:metal ABC transporter solute-binding protein, Zn/Mn family n=1 Tax=Bifidobacterium aquikefiri TaxID=1653207 RepID=UPI0023F3CCA0|nr:zinc ABC transporter substrate-binding protein [Bifidobacterium aquikefiri]
MQLKHVSKAVVATILTGVMALAAAGCGTSSATSGNGKINILAAENEYGDVAKSIGGSHVNVTSIISNPNADPHDFEASPSDVKLIAQAKIVVQNGVGYDDWLNKMLKAHESSDRTVINAQEVLGLPDSTKNPHLWYEPKTMPAVATKIAAKLESIDPNHASDYKKNLQTFNTSMKSYTEALAEFQTKHPSVAVAATEPVANYMLDAAKVDIKTPWTLQAAIMNDQDPSAQDSATQMALFSNKSVHAFVYNQQVTSDLTAKYKAAAKKNGIPIVAVYETMPAKYHYVQWMTSELAALDKAVSQQQSTESL